MKQQLQNKIALITGGNSGIGLATAELFVKEGAFVYITGRRQNELDDAVKKIGKNVRGIKSDVSALADVEKMYDSIKKEKGRLDILFANAGIAEKASLGKITEEHYDRLFDVNVKGVLFTVQLALPLLSEGAS